MRVASEPYLLVGYPGRVLGSILVVQVGGRIHLPYNRQCRSQQVSQHGGTDVECILHLLGSTSTAGLCRYGARLWCDAGDKHDLHESRDELTPRVPHRCKVDLADLLSANPLDGCNDRN